MKNSAATLVVLGLSMLLLSLFAPLLFGERRTWTDTMAQRYQMASQQYHAALHAQWHAASPASHSRGAPELGEAKRTFEQYQSLLDRAATRGQHAARTLRWLGIAASGLGLVLHLAQRMDRSGNQRR